MIAMKEFEEAKAKEVQRIETQKLAAIAEAQRIEAEKLAAIEAQRKLNEARKVEEKKRAAAET